MSRRKADTTDTTPAAPAVAPPTPPTPPPPHVIHPDAVYLREDFRRVFQVRASTLRREVREGRLRISKRAGRYYLLGRWIIEWLEAGEVGRKRYHAEANGCRP